MLDVHRLRLLRELSRRGTLAAVAGALGYSPSLVSHQLAQLEREAGTRLLERVGRRVRLTPAAEALVRHADLVLTQLEAAEAELADLEGTLVGRLRVAMFASAAHTLLVPTLTRLATAAPALVLAVEVLEPELALPRLLAHELDVVVTEEYPGHPLPRCRDVDRQLVVVDPLRLATCASAGRIADLSSVAGTPWVLESRGTPARIWAEAACRAAGFEPEVRFETTDLALHRRLIGQGLAVGMLPDLAGAAADETIALQPLAGGAGKTGRDQDPARDADPSSGAGAA